MAQSLAKIVTHVIFSTKNRRQLIPVDLREELSRYLAGTLGELDCPAIAVACVADHAHVLFCLSKSSALAKVVEKIKASSSTWIKTKGEALDNFHWQNGYGAFSVSESRIGEARAYIARQEDHQRKMTFEEEFRAFLQRHHVAYAERYVLD